MASIEQCERSSSATTPAATAAPSPLEVAGQIQDVLTHPPALRAATPAGESSNLRGSAPIGIDVPGYEILEKVAEGGMGAILRGRDPTLGRELAIKVMKESVRGDPNLVRRFIEEAQIAGQLQHPGIVPIHQLGQLPNGLPFFAMKLVKGRTLAALLKERKDPTHDLPRFLKIFEQIAQAVAYAHDRGVIHRDLKPQNIMVGQFGELQVMDWGLAKVLGTAVDSLQPVRKQRANTIGETQAGEVFGTPAYMPPEQARGEIERLDERTDVFALGAILCEILTGEPAYRVRRVDKLRPTTDVLADAIAGTLQDANARLDACGAEPELIDLAKRCTTSERENRPGDAQAVADAMTAYLTNLQERLKAAEIKWAAAISYGQAEERIRVEAQARHMAEQRAEQRVKSYVEASVAKEAGSIRRQPIKFIRLLTGIGILLGGGGAAAMWLMTLGSLWSAAVVAQLALIIGGGLGIGAVIGWRWIAQTTRKVAAEARSTAVRARVQAEQAEKALLALQKSQASDTLSIVLHLRPLKALATEAQGLVALAELGVKNSPNNAGVIECLAIAHYRAGDYQAAMDGFYNANRLREKNNDDSPNVEACLFLAMTHHRLDNADHAKQLLIQVVEQIEKTKGASWTDRVVWRCLRQEAEELILGKANEPKK